MSEVENFSGGAAAGRPSVCRNCGSIVGAGETVCHVCGAAARGVARATADADDARREDPLAHADPETRRFVRAMVARPATFTLVFITLCVFLFILMMMSGVQQDARVLISYGAKLNSLVDAGQWWRLVTPVFLHGGPVIGWAHLLMNMYGLFVIGPYVEKIYGSARFVVFWVATGVAGVVASYLSVRPGGAETPLGRTIFSDIDSPSVGASGALFGLVGVLFVFGIKFRRELPEGFRRAFGAGMLPVVLLNLALGFLPPLLMPDVPVRIDNAAHLGGFLSGALLALFVGYKRPGERAPVAVAWHALQLGALALVVASFAQVALNFDAPPPTIENLRRTSAAGPAHLDEYVAAVNEAGPAFVAALNGDASGAERVGEALDKGPPLGEKELVLRGELKALLNAAREYGAQGGGDAAKMTRERASRRDALVAAMNAWHGRFDEWVKTEGRNYGIIPREGGE
ncbi:MAG TPA: rhomboid family intramembrane serine protease [Pyrinomonadaceae bacterium]|nr:rhomboid family intramembrane serine protease [Pyrinomonadaceae bacterium]